MPRPQMPPAAVGVPEMEAGRALSDEPRVTKRIGARVFAATALGQLVMVAFVAEDLEIVAAVVPVHSIPIQ